MSGMAEVLAEHDRWTDTKNLGYYRTEYTCQCGGTFWAGDHDGDPSFAEANAAHQAAALSAAGFGDVREQVAKLDAVRALHRGNRWGCCEACSEHIDIPMPCPTRAALEQTP